MFAATGQTSTGEFGWEQRLMGRRPGARGALKPECQQLKFTLHRKLLEKINLEALATIENQRVRAEVRQALGMLIDAEPTLLSSAEKQQVCDEVLDEVFGPEHFVATVIWQKVYSPKNSARHFSEDHDYIVVYARNGERWRPSLLPRTEDMEARYDNPDGDPRGPWKPGDLSARNYYSEGTYPITCPSGRIIETPPSGRYWAIKKGVFGKSSG